MRTVQRKSLVDGAIEVLRERIDSGSWPVGHRLPAEAKLAEELGMSRASVREATRALAHAGMLAARQGDGTFVIATSESDAALRRQLGTAEVVEIIEVRRGLDMAVAHAAALRRTPAELEQLSAALRRRRIAGEQGDEATFVEADIAFHVGLAQAAHNRTLQELYHSFSEVIESTVALKDCFGPGDTTISYDHEDLLAAIRDEDQAAATLAALAILNTQESAVRGR
ncbi:FadR/GntR family transcriptional regulator [Microbacterium sp. ASV81]|uniref:FCD domain-containing protein n=1 Tax=Microbacterium capsulatum TaxID=3041921 RepID=A0ABU0XEP3_9MICO|nr:FCD domain-containing protein [Microbacterium sp. ASV81]MDQ4213587.1 FCD domain-containing protein [Microbacterium sp. ASV81]